MWFFALASGGFKEAAEDGVVFQSLVRASALDDPAHDDDGAQAPFGLIIGGGYSGVAEAGEEDLKFDGVVRLAALGTPGTIHVCVIGVNIATATAAKDPVLGLRRLKAATAQLSVDGHACQTTQHDQDIGKNEIWHGHITKELQARWWSLAFATQRPVAPTIVRTAGWYNSRAATARPFSPPQIESQLPRTWPARQLG